MEKALLYALDDAVLARLLLRIVWQGYDAGGISSGRSLRAFLLEAALEYLPEAKYDFGPMDYRPAIEEGEERIRHRRPVQLILYPGRGRITKLFDCQFVQVLLCEIQRWHREQRRELVFYRQDACIICMAQRLLPHNLRLAKYSRQAVLEEAKVRAWILRQRALERWDRERVEKDQEILRQLNE